MKKKLISLIMALVCVIACAFGLAACDSGNGNKIMNLWVAKTGEQPDGAELNVNITYGETPDLGYKLYLCYQNGDKKEIPLTDEKLTVGYSYYKFNSTGSKPIEKLPDEYLAGSYTIQYTYDGNSDLKALINININQVEGGAFSVQPAKTTWYVEQNTPDVTLKNPKGLAVQCPKDGEELQSNDTNGDYSVYIIKKAVYDAFTEAQKTDYDYIKEFFSADSKKTEHDIWIYFPGIRYGANVGEHMLLATVSSTYNYVKAVTPGVKITVKDTFVERVFTFQSMALKDSAGNIVTDTDNEYVAMTEAMNQENQGKTVICKANGEVRGTVDLGNGAFDELIGEEVFKYRANGSYLAIFTQEDNFLGDGNISGDTLTLKFPMDETCYWVMTLTCN